MPYGSSSAFATASISTQPLGAGDNKVKLPFGFGPSMKVPRLPFRQATRSLTSNLTLPLEIRSS